MAGSKLRVPHTLILLMGMITLAWALSWILPQGTFQRTTLDNGREAVVPGSYGPVDELVRLGPQSVLLAIPQGFAAAADIIFFVFIIGGAFGVFRATGAADAWIGWLLKRFSSAAGLLVAGAMLLFALGSATIGMAEEFLPFVPMLLALCAALRFDAITAIGILCCGYGVGYGAAVLNPFTVIIAWDIAGIQPSLTDFLLRAGICATFLAVAFHHVWSYATRVRRDPTRSLLHGVDTKVAIAGPTDQATSGTAPSFPDLDGRRLAVLASIAVAIGISVYGIAIHHWYLGEMGAIFLGLALLMPLLGGLGPNRTAEEFCKGAAELTTTALLIGFARTIEYLLVQGQVIDTVIQGIAQPLQSLGTAFAAVGMLVVQSACNLFIPSGSGQAYVTMPIMAPLADLVGVPRDVAVLAYQFGDGFTNIVVPTNAVLIGILTLAGIPYDRWLRFVLPFLAKIFVLSSVVLIVVALVG